MTLLASLNEHVGKLVHPGVQSVPAEFDRHRDFLATRLLLSLATLVLAPLFLALGAAPTCWQAGSLAWLLLPLVAATAVSRTGNLGLGEALSVVAWAGLAATLAVGSGSALGLAVLLVLPVEIVAVPAGRVGRSGAAGVMVAALVPAVAGLGLRGGVPGAFGIAVVAGAVLYSFGLAAVTRRRLALERQREASNARRYEALWDAIDEAVVRFDRSGGVVSAGPSTERLFGIRPHALLGRGFFEHVHVADRPAFLKAVTDVAAQGKPGTAVLRLRTGVTCPGERDHQEPVFAWVEVRARPDTAGQDGPEARESAVLALVRDVTAQTLQERAFEEARQAADRSHAGRDLFLANITHELRTPLNAIIGFAEMLASETMTPKDPAKQRDYAAIIHQSGEHLLGVVNGILDASKIESGSFAIVPESFSLADLVTSCCDMVSLKAERAGIAVEREVAAGLPDLVGDVRACKQILLNLLSNALKFTPAQGRVTLTVRPEGTAILLQVADTGIGIGPGDLARVGDPFFQAQAGARTLYDRPHDGTGLGLSVVRGLVGLHGGRISIESAPGQGTCVTVRLPADCRRSAGSGAVTRIETIPRYRAASQRASGAAELAKVKKSA